MTIKVFSMNDCDWMAGETLEACKAEYLRMYTGETGEDAFEDPGEVPADKMAKLRYRDDDDGAVSRSFKEELDRRVAAGQPFPQFFASTEY